MLTAPVGTPHNSWMLPQLEQGVVVAAIGPIPAVFVLKGPRGGHVESQDYMLSAEGNKCHHFDLYSG